MFSRIINYLWDDDADDIPTPKEDQPLFDAQIDLTCDDFIESDYKHKIRVDIRIYYDSEKVLFGILESALFRGSMQEVIGVKECVEIERNEHKVAFRMYLTYKGDTADRESKRYGCIEYLPSRVVAAIRLVPSVVGGTFVTPKDVRCEIHSVSWM